MKRDIADTITAANEVRAHAPLPAPVPACMGAGLGSQAGWCDCPAIAPIFAYVDLRFSVPPCMEETLKPEAAGLRL